MPRAEEDKPPKPKINTEQMGQLLFIMETRPKTPEQITVFERNFINDRFAAYQTYGGAMVLTEKQAVILADVYYRLKLNATTLKPLE